MTLAATVSIMQRFKSEFFSEQRSRQISIEIMYLSSLSLGLIILEEKAGLVGVPGRVLAFTAGISQLVNHILDAAAITRWGNSYRNNIVLRAFAIGACSTSLTTRLALCFFNNIASGTTEKLIIVNGLIFAYTFATGHNQPVNFIRI